MGKIQLLIRAGNALASALDAITEAASDDGKIDKEEVFEILEKTVIGFLTG